MMDNCFKDFSWDYRPDRDPYAERTNSPVKGGRAKYAEVIFFSKLESALLGIVEHDEHPPVACYSCDGVITIFQEKHGFTPEDAETALEQLIKSNLGPSSPCFLDTSILEK
tara:strand:- start:400 stop:732 length:333 start_codon:yes stop_codon:yes gene_type:complete